MTLPDLTMARPPRREARWVGVALAAVLITAGTRLGPELLSGLPGSTDANSAGPNIPPAAASDQSASAAQTGLVPPDERIAFWEPRVAADSRDYLSALHLADAYLDRARATADLADLQRAEAVLAQIAGAAPDSTQVLSRQAQVAFSLHEFSRAAVLADQVIATAPQDLTALAVAADARLEMGDLAGARERYDRLATLAPSGPVWSRLGRLAWLEGDVSDALALIQRAISDADANGFGEESAFYRNQLGELLRATGDLGRAAAAYESALKALPGYPAATIGLAAVRDQQGRRSEAIALLEAATTRLPTPEAVAALGDLYLLDGNTADASRQFALVERIGEVAQATGSVYDRQLVLFAADHDRDAITAVARARAELEIRTDIYGWDALAWALYKAGRLDEAAASMAQALTHGTPDPRLAYHAGMISAARGETARARDFLARALVGAAYLPPLQIPVAERTLASLGGAADEARP